MRPTLLCSIIYSLVTFPLTPIYVTLNDLEWPLYVKFCFVQVCLQFLCALFESSCVKNKGRPYCQQQKCLSWTLVSGNIHVRFMQIFTGFLKFLCEFSLDQRVSVCIYMLF